MTAEVVWRLPKAQAMSIMALLTEHRYSQVAEILHTLQTQFQEQTAAPRPAQITVSRATPESGGRDGTA